MRTAYQLTLRSLHTDSIAAECVRVLDQFGVPTLLLKGPTTARWLYRDGTPRPYADCDLLVPRAQRQRARTILAGRGFVDSCPGLRPDEWPHHAVTLRRGTPGDSECVDLHHGLALTEPGAPVWEVLSRAAEDTIVCGQPVRMPDEAGRCLVLALHAVQHGGHGRPMEDLRRALAVAHPRSWSWARGLATELGARPAFELGLALAGNPTSAPPAELLARAPLRVRLRATGAVRGTDTLAAIYQRRGVDRLRYTARRLLPSRGFIADRYGARSPLALPAGYLRHLASAAAGLPAALRALAAVSTATVDSGPSSTTVDGKPSST